MSDMFQVKTPESAVTVVWSADFLKQANFDLKLNIKYIEYITKEKKNQGDHALCFI